MYDQPRYLRLRLGYLVLLPFDPYNVTITHTLIHHLCEEHEVLTHILLLVHALEDLAYIFLKLNQLCVPIRASRWR